MEIHHGDQEEGKEKGFEEEVSPLPVELAVADRKTTSRRFTES